MEIGVRRNKGIYKGGLKERLDMGDCSLLDISPLSSDFSLYITVSISSSLIWKLDLGVTTWKESNITNLSI